ncbi:MAG: phage virion morphogenesis protein [Azoarcus sp.]|jgi:phage virion morphogenesis protein|nr:phage virion morphogenesis protein [Azoarcus sp.]
MNADIDGIEQVDMALDGLIAALSPAGRRKLGLKLGQSVRRANQARIAKNIAPDGTAFAPRAQQKGGKIRCGKMFKKLKAARHMRIERGASEIRLSFQSRAGRIAAVHHFGLRDKVTPKGKVTVKYPARPLLGFSHADLATLDELVFAHFEASLR